MNANKFVKISKVLDSFGFFSQADKIDQFIKIAQFAKMPSQYQPNAAPRTNNPLIDTALTNMEDSAFGYHMAGGNQYNMKAPYKSEFGPSGPAILPTLTPTQFAKLEREGKFQEIFDLQMLGGLQAQQFLAMGNENLIGLATLARIYAQPEVSENVRSSFFNYVFPTTIAKTVAQDLEARPLSQWSGRLNEFLTDLKKNAPQQEPIIRQSIKSSLESLIKKKTLESSSFIDKVKSNPDLSKSIKDLQISLPEA